MSQLSLIRAGMANYELPATQDWKFARNKTLVSSKGITPSFSRASTGTYFNSSGVLSSAAINEARFDHVYNSTTGLWESRGLLVEEQRTNLALWSQDFSNASWTKRNNTITTGAAVAPDGTTTANKFAETVTNASHDAYPAASLNAGTTATMSVFLKAAERSWGFVSVDFGKSAYFNLASGTVGTVSGTATASITPVGNGWYRCTLMATGAILTNQPVIGIASGDGVSTYAGTAGNGIYVWGAQFEAGAFPTSYIPTTSSSVTRSADVCQVTGASFSGFWNATEGSISVEFDRLGDFSSGTFNNCVLNVHDGTANNEHLLIGNNTANNLWITASSVQQANFGSFSYMKSAQQRISYRFKLNDFAVTTDGNAALTDTSGTVPTVNQMSIGLRPSSGPFPFNGHFSRIRYFNKALTDKQLEDLGRPELSKALDLQFASTKSLTPLVGPRPDFSRASSGSFTNANGVLVKANVNNCLWSEDLTNAAWTKDGCSIASGFVTAPDGSLTALKVVENSSNSLHRLYQNIGATLTQPTISMYFKPAGRTWVDLILYNNASAKVAYFNLTGAGSTGTTSGLVTSSIQALPNGWYRCSVTLISGPANGIFIQPQMASGDGGDTYAGDGVSGMYMWGGQIEDAATVGEYGKTTSSATAGPRFDHTYDGTNWISRGLLIEEQRTNQLLRSHEFDNAYWQKSNGTVSANVALAPDGTMTADKFTENNVNTYHQLGGYISGLSFTIGQRYTFSVYMKAAGRNWGYVGLGDSSIFGDTTAYFNLAAGTVGTIVQGTASPAATASITNVGNGWYRCELQATCKASTTVSGAPGFGPASADNTQSYLGDGSSGIYCWGAQIEAGAASSSMIPTSGSTVTRSADVCSITGTNFSGMWNADEDTIICGFSRPMQIQGSGLIYPRSFMVGTGSSNFLNHYTNHGSPYKEEFDMYSGGVAQFTLEGGIANDTSVKYALGFRANDAAVSVKGAAVVTDATVTVPAFATNLRLGALDTGANMLNGWLSSFQVYTIRLPNRLLVQNSS